MGKSDRNSGERPAARGTHRLTVTGAQRAIEVLDAQPRLVVMAGAQLGEPFLIEAAADALVGRDYQADLVLDSRSVSRRHARVTREREHVFIEDLGSANGTDVAGQRIDRRTELRNGDLIRLGTATLKFFASESFESEYHNRLFQMATRDSLTGLHNRGYFMDALERMLRQHAARRQPLAVAIVDLDYFKLINDEYGHDVGDRSLEEVARVLLAGVEEEDVVARIGGEEFGLLFHATEPEQAAERLHLIQAALLELTRGPAQPTLSFSAGVATVPIGTVDVDPSVLLKRADQALYSAKEAGRDRVEIAD